MMAFPHNIIEKIYGKGENLIKNTIHFVKVYELLINIFRSEKEWSGRTNTSLSLFCRIHFSEGHHWYCITCVFIYFAPIESLMHSESRRCLVSSNKENPSHPGHNTLNMWLARERISSPCVWSWNRERTELACRIVSILF